MKNPKNPIELNDLPHLKAEKPDDMADYVKSDKKDTNNESKTRSRTAIWPAITVLILCIIGVSFWNNSLTTQLHEQRLQTKSALERINALEQRLSSTDESVNQSSITVQVRLKELKKRSDELWEQMDKLWASAWRRNQKDLADQSRALEKIKQTQLKSETAQTAQAEHTMTLMAEMTAVQAKIDGIDALNTAMTKLDKAFVHNDGTLSRLRQQVDVAQSSLQQVQKKVDDNSGWVESNLTFRKQTNQKLDRLEQRIKRLEPQS